MFNKFLVFFFICVLVKGSLSQAGVCYNPLVEPGQCRASIPRYGFDVNQGRCRPFIWGGCNNNGNNFYTLGQCQQACGRK